MQRVALFPGSAAIWLAASATAALRREYAERPAEQEQRRARLRTRRYRAGGNRDRVNKKIPPVHPSIRRGDRHGSDWLRGGRSEGKVAEPGRREAVGHVVEHLRIDGRSARKGIDLVTLGHRLAVEEHSGYGGDALGARECHRDRVESLR